MADQEKNGAQPERQLRGLYKHVKVSVKTLNWAIAVLCAALVICLVIGISNGGYQVSFDTLGGTTVESQKRMYGELVEAPEPPTREGYLFDGWYRDVDTAEPWDLETDVVTGSMTLYAGWREAP